MIEAIAPGVVGDAGPTSAGRDRLCIVAAARACVGTRFRAQGRCADTGLDCVGLVLVAVGVDPAVVPAYALGGDHADLLDAVLVKAGCHRVVTALPGDILVLAPVPRLRHLAIVTNDGVIQAHAGLGRVVEGPPDPDWPCLAAWRAAGAH